jgi:hypothetical protein
MEQSPKFTHIYLNLKKEKVRCAIVESDDDKIHVIVLNESNVRAYLRIDDLSKI